MLKEVGWMNKFKFIILSILIFGGAIKLSYAHSSKKIDTTKQTTIGGDFILIDKNGQKFSSEKLKDKKKLVFFGFTSCPAVCPTAMTSISIAAKKINKKYPEKVAFVFISVDPERDTPKALRDFANDYDPSIIWLTGSKKELDAVARQYKVYHQKEQDSKPNDDVYNINHSSIIYLVDEKNQYLGHETHNSTPDKIESLVERFI